ncbi:MAG: outer membrane beta-barrel protein [Mucilaginibacter sp.]
MKKIILFLAFILVKQLVFAQGQLPDSVMMKLNGRVSFSIEAGYTQAGFYGTDKDSVSANGKTTTIAGCHVGIIAHTALGKEFFLQHELMLTQKGAGVSKLDANNKLYDTELRMLTLDLFPASPTYRIGGFELFAGPYLSMLVNGHYRLKDVQGNFYNKEIYGRPDQLGQTEKYLEKIDYGINAGVSFSYKALSLRVKYVQGFAEVLDDPYALNVGNPKTSINVYNRYLNFSVAYRIW